MPEGTAVTILVREADETFEVPPELEAELLEPITDRNEQLRQSLSHPHPESLEMAEVGFATWAEGLSDDASDLFTPDAGQKVRWTPDRGWVGTEE